MRSGKGRVYVPSPRHRTLWIDYPVRVSPDYPRGRAKENTGIPVAEPGSKEWKRAEKALADHVRAFQNDRDGIAVQVVPARKTFAEYGEEILGRVTRRPRAANTVRGERSMLKTLSKTFEKAKVQNIDEAAIERYQRARLTEGIRGKTINAEVALLLRILRRAKVERARPDVPEVTWLDAGTGKREYLVAARIEAAITILRRTFPGFADLTEAFHICGLRPKALGRLTVEMVKGIGAAREIHVPAELMKIAREHRLPVFGRFAEIIDARLADPGGDGLLFHDGHGRSLLAGGAKDGLSNPANEAWSKARVEAGLPEGWGFYGIRACFNTRALNAGAAQSDVDAALAHARDAVTETYLLNMAPMVKRAMVAAELGAKLEARGDAEVVEFRKENAQ